MSNFQPKKYKICKEDNVVHSQKKLTEMALEETQTLGLLDKHLK